MFWELMETASNYFYEPLIFWSVPIVLALVQEGVRGMR